MNDESLTVNESLTVREVTPETWPDFERLFEAKGGPSYCWCMAFRATRAELTRAGGPTRKQQMADRVRSGVPVGILGYLASEPVAWCSVAPRNTFRNLVSDGSPDQDVWAITCFYVARKHRRTHIASAMLEAAVSYARRSGAKLVEGYPVDPDSPSYRHMGRVSWFEKAGFVERGRQGTRRRIMELRVE